MNMSPETRDNLLLIDMVSSTTALSSVSAETRAEFFRGLVVEWPEEVVTAIGARDPEERRLLIERILDRYCMFCGKDNVEQGHHCEREEPHPFAGAARWGTIETI